MALTARSDKHRTHSAGTLDIQFFHLYHSRKSSLSMMWYVPPIQYTAAVCPASKSFALLDVAPELPIDFQDTGSPLDYYNPMEDSRQLKKDASKFESLRNNYPLRREKLHS